MKRRNAIRDNEPKLRSRHLALDVRALDREKREMPVSFSSETREVLAWDYELGGAVPEILSHADGACDLSPLLNAGSILRNHDANQIVGIPLEASIDANAKRGVARIKFGTTPKATEAFQEVADGMLRGISVGYEVTAYERVKAGARSSHGHEGPCLVATSWRVHEITLTPIPADSSVGVGRSKPAAPAGSKENDVMDPKLIRQLVRAAGLSLAFADTLIARKLETEEEVQSAIAEERKLRGKTPKARKLAAAGVRSDAAAENDENREDTNGDGTDDDEDEMDGEDDGEEARSVRPSGSRLEIHGAARCAAIAERERCVEIRAAVRNAKLGDDLAEDLIERGTPIAKARKIILDKLAENDVPAVGAQTRGVAVTADGGEKRLRFIATNLGRRAFASMGLPESDFDSKDTKKIERGAVSLHEAVVGAMEVAGERDARFTPKEQLWQNFLQRSFASRGQRAANSSGDLANALSALQNKALHQGYKAATATWRAWARKGSLTDFKIAPWVQVSDAAQLRETGENGEILDSKLNDRAENRQLAVYARKISFGMEAFINDDLGVLAGLPYKMGKSAAALPSRLIYTALLANPTMSDSVALFHAASHGNLRTGGTSNLDQTNKVTALTQAVMDFRKQTAMRAPNDTEFPAEPIEVEPRVLIVPPEHEYAAYQLANPNLFVAETQFFKNKFDIQVEPRLSNTGYTGYSLTAWYLAGAAADCDTAEVSFLNGNEQPITMSWEDFNSWGMNFRAVLPCGVKFLDWRTIHKNAGA